MWLILGQLESIKEISRRSHVRGRPAHGVARRAPGRYSGSPPFGPPIPKWAHSALYDHREPS